ncbi:4Fe-4S dicluster domain-containing protein [Paeniroseomonas aquatica]|uniref:4Fe-4S dicluster domain-containing protein n=1 Tax=Paeniroseomonas aquatica TaxID=373043 RepID=A0ABT8A499_9PROT|nr:4Fe-4S dicluster domain-containing protein [Paeniroseomonas aquatica]MDN3564196.1 4Fe-4S dicluster domain-containing protein [Paeniroseomonas aquatica]
MPPHPMGETAGRRDVLLMGASVALAAAGCDGPDEHGHPLHARPRGVAAEDASYATVLDLEGLGRGVLVRTRAGHAVKLEGNPQHPASLGATDIFAEAAVLSLHDPERSRRIRRDGAPLPPAELDAALAEARAALRTAGGAGLRLLTGPIASPTLARLIGEVLAAYPGARWHQHDPLADDAALAGAMAAFGRPVAVLPDLGRARAVLCLGADPLGPGPAQLRQARDWSSGRREGRAAGRMPRLFVAEASPSLTGARADRRIPLHPAEAEGFARAVAAALGVPGLARQGAHPEAAGIAAALREAGPAGLVLAGRGQPPAVHALALAMNQALGAPGTSLRLTVPPLAQPEPMAASLAGLTSAMAANEVTHLLVLGANPLAEAPAALGFAAALRRVGFTLHAGQWVDETAHACRWHVPLPHPLEAWGDARASCGTPAIRQPVTLPLVEAARGEAELLSALLGPPQTARAAVANTWRTAWGEADFESRWDAALEAGIAGEPAPAIAPALRPDWDRPGEAAPATLTAVFAPDIGPEAQNAWLQEMPRPLTGLAWGNAALFDPLTAATLGLAPGDEAELTLEGRQVLAACWPVPGQAPGCVTLPLGGGRRAAGAVGTGRGFDANRLRPADGAWAAPGLAVRATGRRAALVATQAHHRPDEAGAVPRLAPGEALAPIQPGASLHPDWAYEGRAWAMSIDVDACIGCNACAIACQAENNVPVVGPEELARGRGMHWLRIDRYDAPPAAPAAASFQPVPCMHCEKAPCEPVCPVNATVHDSEGLNVMVHARCVGTRTCSNNCPYKVRRFNWDDHRRALDTPRRNPEVALRPRGVMEKCTYCSHRITAARTQAGLEGRALRDGEVETACQRACPTQAITFGDLNAPGSAVAALRRDGRSYALLGHLETRPRTTYLAQTVPGETA